ncbi:MAG: hypothetical protein MUW56_22200 [Chryseobacterium sp.]|uniref:hypothetical protein n=1 Tax=Chryseobacterium sp. TaxID=1871047 RepID=UPI0025B7F1F2|nr:hypothetical protein [Chryseobacterium sp.]MCJ7936267.1 hypothetical protein [Chryseobacterium sp.]
MKTNINISPFILLSFCVFLFSCKTKNIFEEKKPAENREDFKYENNYRYKIRKDKITLSVCQDDLSVGSVHRI